MPNFEANISPIVFAVIIISFLIDKLLYIELFNKSINRNPEINIKFLGGALRYLILYEVPDIEGSLSEGLNIYPIFTSFNYLAPQENLWGKPTWKYTKTINGSRFQSALEASEFELKFILAYWGLIGFDFGFINLSNVFIDRLRVPKYHFIAPNKRSNLTHKFFYRSKC